MSTIWLIPYAQLTPEQQRAIALPHTRHQVIVGAPGSGKTQILLHRAHELRRRLGVSPDRFRIFVYTNVLKTYIRSALHLLELPETSVTTFDDWCHIFLKDQCLERIPWDSRARRPDFEAIRQRVLQRVEHASFNGPLFDFVLVDEGQDLPPVAYRILRRIARHITVCMDYKQQLYEHGASEDSVLQTLGLRRPNLSLLDAYRSSQLVAEVAAQCIENPEERQHYLAQVRVATTERQLPLLYMAPTIEAERRLLVEALRQRLLLDAHIGILVPTRRLLYSIASYLRSEGIEVEIQQRRSNEPQNALDFTSRRPKLITFHSAKGLMFDSVFLPGLTAGNFARYSESRVRRLLFVALTRASRWLFMSSLTGDPLPLLEDFRPLVRTRKLAFREDESVPSVHTPEPPPSSNDLDFL